MLLVQKKRHPFKKRRGHKTRRTRSDSCDSCSSNSRNPSSNTPPFQNSNTFACKRNHTPNYPHHSIPSVQIHWNNLKTDKPELQSQHSYWIKFHRRRCTRLETKLKRTSLVNINDERRKEWKKERLDEHRCVSKSEESWRRTTARDLSSLPLTRRGRRRCFNPRCGS